MSNALSVLATAVPVERARVVVARVDTSIVIVWTCALPHLQPQQIVLYVACPVPRRLAKARAREEARAEAKVADAFRCARMYVAVQTRNPHYQPPFLPQAVGHTTPIPVIPVIPVLPLTQGTPRIRITQARVAHTIPTPGILDTIQEVRVVRVAKVARADTIIRFRFRSRSRSLLLYLYLYLYLLPFQRLFRPLGPTLALATHMVVMEDPVVSNMFAAIHPIPVIPFTPATTATPVTLDIHPIQAIPHIHPILATQATRDTLDIRLTRAIHRFPPFQADHLSQAIRVSQE